MHVARQLPATQLARTVAAPDGERWKVGRRWMARPFPNPWRRRKPKKEGGGWPADGWLDAATLGSSPDELLLGIALTLAGVIAAALFVFVLLPLLGIAFELAVVITISSSGILGRVFLGRPLDDRGRQPRPPGPNGHVRRQGLAPLPPRNP